MTDVRIIRPLPVDPSFGVSRRGFLAASLAAPAALLAACSSSDPSGTPVSDGHLLARPGTPTGSITAGLHELGLESSGPDGFIWVPASYDPAVPAPLIVLLHGAGQTSAEWSEAPLETLFGSYGAIVVGPDSRSRTWDLVQRGLFYDDVEFIDRALAKVFSLAAIDPSRIALGGFSDGASYALSLGLSNGDLFGEIMAFSPGFAAPQIVRGMPRIFDSHGISDPILPIAQTSRIIVPNLRSAGYDVTYVEFAGGHTLTLAVAQLAVDWWLGGEAAAGAPRRLMPAASAGR